MQVDGDVAGTHTEPHFVVTSPGNVDVVYYRTPATGEPNGYCGQFVTSPIQTTPCNDGFARFDDPTPTAPLLPPPVWSVEMAQSTNALSASPTFTHTTIADAVHVGEICTNGIVCGSSDRSLLDYMTVQVDCGGMAHVAFAGNTVAEETADFANGAANIHEVNQTGGSALGAPAACSAKTASAAPTPSPSAAPPVAPAVALPNTGAASPAAGAGVAALLSLGAAALLRRRHVMRRRRPPL